MTLPVINLEGEELPDSCYVFKHSTQCPRSAQAADVVKTNTFNKPIYWINVIEQRELSNWVETAYQTRHESPQFLDIETGKVEQVWNHLEINPENLASCISV